MIDNWKLVSVVRIGYGDYAGQARVLRPVESTNEFAARRWTRIADLAPISFPMEFVIVAAEIATASDPPILIVKGATVSLTGFDKDGDLKVLISGRWHAIFLEDAIALESL